MNVDVSFLLFQTISLARGAHASSPVPSIPTVNPRPAKTCSTGIAGAADALVERSYQLPDIVR